MYTQRFGIFCAALIAASGISYAQNNDHPAVPPTGRGELRPHVWIKGNRGPGGKAGSPGPLTPDQIASAYGLATAGTGQGATVAIVDAYDSPNAASDLALFSSKYGITCSTGGGTLTKRNQSGGVSPLPARNSGWEVEINLDTQWVHAVAPCANIVLVEANSSSTADLMTAVNTAKGLAKIVSMSWGGKESASQTSLDGAFNQTGVTFLASSGDTGGQVEWPSSSPYVISVGGTNLTFNSNGSVASETAWSGSGGGCSAVEPAISAQTGFVPSSCQNRATPDVAMDGGSSSAVSVYISKQGGWFAVYGTSLSAQLWAGVIALAGHPASALSSLYLDAAGSYYGDNYRDITSGKAGKFSAAAGWDFVTGLGCPVASSLVPRYLATQ